MPPIFFGPPKSSRVLAWQRVLGGVFLSPSILRKQRRLAGRPPQRPVRSSGPGPLFKKGTFLPFPSFLCLQAGRRGGALLPGKKGKGVGPAQAGKGWPPGGLQGGDPLQRPWTLPSFLCQRKVPKAGLPGKPQGSLRAAFVAFLPELS